MHLHKYKALTLRVHADIWCSEVSHESAFVLHLHLQVAKRYHGNYRGVCNAY
jgi:hypothetical protein